MEVTILVLLVFVAIIIIGPFIVPFFLPNLKGFSGCSSLLIGLLLVCLLGWWGILIYLLLVYIGTTNKFNI